MNKAQERAADIAAQVVAAYVSHNVISAEDLPGLTARTYAALEGVFSGQPNAIAPRDTPSAEEIAASITDDAIISFENGRRYRSLRRHLNQLGLTDDQYRAKWGLPDDYPLVAKSFSDLRSSAARAQRFGGLAVAAE